MIQKRAILTHSPARAFSALAVLTCLLVVSAGNARAQLTTGDVVGTVTDPSGAVIPNADVVITDLAAGQARSTTTDANGQFTFDALKASHYSLAITAKGFQKYGIKDVALSAGQRERLDAALQLGSESQVVEVAGAAIPALETDSATLSTNVSEKPVQELPLNGRNFVQLAQLAAGANEGPPQSIASGSRPDDRRQTSSVSVNGQSELVNNEMVDGMDNNERIIGTIGVRPSIDAISEFRVQTNLYTAEVGRTAGGVINIITKSGSNQLHGSAYEFLRNNALDARDFFARTGPAPELRQNQFGGSIGGPIRKDKTFFFGDYEGLRIRQGTTQTTTVPTLFEEQHPGNFSDIGGPVISPALDPIGLHYFQLYPAPNQPGVRNNFTYSPNRTQNSDTFDVRLDHHLSANDSLFGRYTYNRVNTLTPGALPAVNGIQPGGNLNAFAGAAAQLAQNYQANYVHIFNPHLLLTLRAGYTRINNASYPLDFGQNVSQSFGIVGANLNAITSGLTPVTAAGYADLGGSTFVPLQYLDNTFQYNSSLAYVRGAHSLNIGAALIRRQASELQNPQGIGYFTFTAAYDGNSLAALLSGHPFTVQRTNNLYVPGYRTWEPSVYFEDDWRATKWLTLNLGLRYDIFSPPTEARNRIGNFDPSTATIMIAGQNGVSSSAGVHTDYRDFAPRIGFAATVLPNTVVRGGFGMTYWPDDIGFPFFLANQPFTFTYTPNPNSVLLSAPLPVPVASSPTALAGTVHGISQNYRAAYLEQFNLNVEHQFGANLVSAGYVGELGRRLNITSNIDLALPAPNQPGCTSNCFVTRRPFYSQLPNVSTIPFRNSEGYSNYNAFQARYERQYSNGLTASANYTWSHGINDVISYSNNTIGEAYNAVPTETAILERGNSDLDTRQRVAVQLSYDLPFGRSLTGGKAVLVQGWQVNAIEVWETGLPFTIVNSSPRTNTGVGANGDRPNQIASASVADPSIFEWFNTAAFVPQPLGTIGNVPRDSLYGPHFRHLDMSVFKNIPLRESRNLQFRAEFFNLTNTPNFANPVQQLGTPSFGTINSTRVGSTPRQIQLAVKFLF